jgi:hypothetical protein
LTRIEKAPRRQTFIIVLIFWLIAGVAFGVPSGLLFGPAHGLFSALVLGLGTALSAGLFWGLRSRHRNLISDIQSVETLRWSWVHARKAGVIGLIMGFAFGLVFGLVFGAGLRDLPRWLAGLTYGPTFGLYAALIGCLFGGLRSNILDIKAIPNLGVKLSIRNAALMGGLGLMVFGVIDLASEEFAGVFFGSILGLIAFLWYGGQDVIQHYILRSILYWKGGTPFHYANFLDYAARLLFLQKVGGGYIFIHRLLLEHFAAMREDEKESALKSGVSSL